MYPVIASHILLKIIQGVIEIIRHPSLSPVNASLSDYAAVRIPIFAAGTIFEEYCCEYAVMKSKSPSCGCGLIHNGKFDGGLIEGNGVTAQHFLDHGYKVMTETEWLEEQHD